MLHISPKPMARPEHRLPSGNRLAAPRQNGIEPGMNRAPQGTRMYHFAMRVQEH